MDRDGLEEWLLGQVERTSQSSVARLLGVNQSQVSRWVRGSGEMRGVLREAVERYVTAYGIEVVDGEAATGENPDAAVGDGADAVGQEVRVEESVGRSGERSQGETGGEDDEDAAVDNTDAPDVAGQDLCEQAETDVVARGDRPSEGRRDTCTRADSGDKAVGADDTHAQDAETAGCSANAPVVSGAVPDATSSGANGPYSLLDRIYTAETPPELAALASAPVLVEVSLEAARAGAQAVARGWQWMRDAPPEGLHGDALFYLHTREEVSFEDEGAKRVAFAPDTEMFQCGLTGAELRYGVHPRRRQKRYAVERHEDREMFIGIRMAALVPERPYPDETWFFGSSESAGDGERQPCAAEVIAARRKMLAMVSSFPDNISGKPLTPWQFALINEQMRVELLMVNRHYRLTIGEHVDGDRTWAPSTRLGIETRWRNAEIALNEAEIRRLQRRRRLGAALLWLPRLPGRIARRIIFELRRGLAEYGPPEPVDPNDPQKGVRCPRVHETVLPSLHEPEKAKDDKLATRLLKRLLYPHEDELDGQVCGETVWTVTDASWSGEYRRLWRAHEFDKVCEPLDPPAAPPPGHLRRIMIKLSKSDTHFRGVTRSSSDSD